MMLAWLPSHKGLFLEWPHLHRSHSSFVSKSLAFFQSRETLLVGGDYLHAEGHAAPVPEFNGDALIVPLLASMAVAGLIARRR